VGVIQPVTATVGATVDTKLFDVKPIAAKRAGLDAGGFVGVWSKSRSSPINPTSGVGRGDARSTQIGSRDFISKSFQLNKYSGEPFKSVFACNLLAKDRCRSALGDEIPPSRPHMALVVEAFVKPEIAERLAGTRACPNNPLSRESGPIKGELPSSDAGEEVTSCKPLELMSLYLCYVAVID